MFSRSLPGVIAIILGVLYWPFESFVHSWFFHEGTFYEQLFTTESNEFWMRSTISITFICFGIYVAKLLTHQASLIENMSVLTKALAQAGEAIIITSTQGDIEYVNQAFTATTGYQLSEVIGKKPSILQSGKQDQEFYKAMWTSIATKGAWKGKIWNKRKDGTVYPEQLHIQGVKNKHGVIVQYVGTFSDITEQILLEDQLRQSQKMEAIGTLAGGIAHDFNNILAYITGNLFLIKDGLQDHPEIQEKISHIEEEAFRAADMIKHLLTFARKNTTYFKPFNLNDLMQQTLNLAKATLPSKTTLKLNIESEPLIIMGDISQVEQVFLNILNNAQDAIENANSPQIIIKLSTQKVSDKLRSKHATITDDYYACMEITDNGCGIESDNIANVFDPFYTTKDIGKGTGLGLSMAIGAIQSHKGVIDVDSIPGLGTSFKIYLPLETNNKIELQKANTPLKKDNRESILIVDDEAEFLSTHSQLLSHLGYQVTTASNADDALNLFLNETNHFDLAMLDIVMPGKNGDELARALRSTSPALPIIFMTGYDSNHIPASISEITDSLLIFKPANISALNKSIQKILHKA
ncbi:MAG: hypothetical protein CO186_02375 [Zetaproteobacteria bacterium CG_4_9_14_3_um_filter_49_83]|nr:MAG: hypothetical protein AUJ56_06420 [Zetaproteobacteria bacterium CG1_02_49_23]PIQ33453.1 MAG: hypothetical protein COW62_05140 [Zetaproteobacteria bacterium CG17_big_fil_post_rev_8_21_14_2_50_50_13]PIV30313.1 MAG: hypothetical protein COS35_07275 [Zetaproteobacteria bacterium CG02_land_8_20_14_3_00_50_9]PIY55660.1 MAG: hypothetical protein COZ00_08205 [Zetaproteobacteria bacterium CG_4_10_14_0_8_um_filter_49_80]PJA36010.1 MAG: hypothetical protein CO186_02375 [Zetaproteobacteria bacterium